MRKATMKIRSQRGASLSFSLMLFLVCAMASAVAIVSATASSGWMTKVAESDQRYYAVNSAANMLKEQLDGQKVELVEETTVTTEQACDASGTPSSGTTPTVTTSIDTCVQYTQNGNKAGNTVQVETDKEKFTSADTVQYYPGNPMTSPLIGASCYIAGVTTDPEYKVGDGVKTQIQIGSADNPLNVFVQEIVTDPDSNTLYITLWKDKKDDLAYAVKLTFVADQQEVTNEHTETKPLVKNATGYTSTTVKTTKKTKTFVWELVSINKSSKPADPPAGGGTPVSGGTP